MDMIILDRAEYTTHPAHNACLLTVMDVAAPYNMAPHLFFQPAMILASANRIPLHLRRAFHMFIGKIMVTWNNKIFFNFPQLGK